MYTMQIQLPTPNFQPITPNFYTHIGKKGDIRTQQTPSIIKTNGV